VIALSPAYSSIAVRYRSSPDIRGPFIISGMWLARFAGWTRLYLQRVLSRAWVSDVCFYGRMSHVGYRYTVHLFARPFPLLLCSLRVPNLVSRRSLLSLLI